ncbi:hypothetical protein [Faecalispora anaeroviscerum]|uniref:hypothetical protein n=1 Tax=Faecalispora anaeroviscerum TaxID=2991836 RepID=UPI0024B88F6E|nr:hypothetical protein [Faecalispora anaeroviscerum]
MAKAKNQGTAIPKHELEALAETLYPSIREFFESKQGQAEFKAWQEQQTGKTVHKQV